MFCAQCLMKRVQQDAEARCGRGCWVLGAEINGQVFVWAYDRPRCFEAGCRIAGDTLEAGGTIQDAHDLLEQMDGKCR